MNSWRKEIVLLLSKFCKDLTTLSISFSTVANVPATLLERTRITNAKFCVCIAQVNVVFGRKQSKIFVENIFAI
jgi:hypothetical protein